jgi:hypothetical protein
MPDEQLYNVGFDSTDDAELDAETTLLEDHPMRLDDIKAACERYRVRARFVSVDGGNEVQEYVPPNERRVPFERASAS